MNSFVLAACEHQSIQLFLGAGKYDRLSAQNFIGLTRFRPLSQNGYLISIFASVRAAFLTFAFPPLIAWGRHLYGAPPPNEDPEADSTSSELDGEDGADTPAKSSAKEGDEDGGEHQMHMQDSTHHSTFDLKFLRGSILVTGMLTLPLLWSTQGWQMYMGKLGCSSRDGQHGR